MGTRLGGLFPDLPKPMIPVAGKPILQYQVEGLVKQGISDITLITGHMSKTIREHFGSGEGLGASLNYIVEDEPLGTGGALCLLPREDTLVLLGDLYLDIDFARFMRFHREHGAAISLFAHPNSHPYDSDLVVTDGGARVAEWVSKRGERKRDYRNLVNAGVYIFSADALPQGVAVKRDLERDLIVPQIPSGGVFAYRSTEYVKDMGTPGRLTAVARDIASGAAAAKSLKNKQRAVFLDRDGTINIEDGHIRRPEQLSLLPGAAQAIRELNSSLFLAVCVTNQPVIARGDATLDELEAIHARLDTLLGNEGAYLDDLLFCPHHPDKGFEGEVAKYKTDCTCRKPKAGMLLETAERYNIDLAGSYMIGDRTADIVAGKAAGCKALGVLTGAALGDGKHKVQPDGIYASLEDAVKMIVSEGMP